MSILYFQMAIFVSLANVTTHDAIEILWGNVNSNLVQILNLITVFFIIFICLATAQRSVCVRPTYRIYLCMPIAMYRVENQLHVFVLIFRWCLMVNFYSSSNSNRLIRHQVFLETVIYTLTLSLSLSLDGIDTW